MREWWSTQNLGVMDDYSKAKANPPLGIARLARPARRLIASRFRAAWQKSNSARPLNGADERFLTNLEWYAEQHLMGLVPDGSDRLSAQATTEKLEAVANALDSLASAVEKAPALDCWLALGLGMGKLDASPSKLLQALLPIPLPVSWPLANSGEALPSLSSLAAAFRAGLPEVKQRRKSGSRYFEDQLAFEIVDSLDDCGIKASTSSTGLAGLAFEATCELAGKTPGRAGYWLKSAIDALPQLRQDMAAAAAMANRTEALQLTLLDALQRSE